MPSTAHTKVENPHFNLAWHVLAAANTLNINMLLTTVFQLGISMHKASAHACTNTHTHTYTLCTNTHTREYIQTKPNTDMHSHPQFAHLHKAESGQSNHGNVVHHQYIPDLNGLV